MCTGQAKPMYILSSDGRQRILWELKILSVRDTGMGTSCGFCVGHCGE